MILAEGDYGPDEVKNIGLIKSSLVLHNFYTGRDREAGKADKYVDCQTKRMTCEVRWGRCEEKNLLWTKREALLMSPNSIDLQHAGADILPILD